MEQVGESLSLPSGNTTVLKEVPFYPTSGYRNWYFWKDPSIANGEFFRYYSNNGPVWETAGGSTAVGTPIVLAPQKEGLDATKHQRWVFSENGRIYSIKEYPWKYVNVTPTGEIVLDNLNVNSPHQIFKRLSSIIYEAAVRCYTPNLEVNITVATNGFGNYTLGTHKYFTFPTINGFKISITATNGTLLRSYTVSQSYSENIFGTPIFPVGYHLYNFTRFSTQIWHYSANVSFANGQINGARLINGTIPSTYPIKGTYTPKGDVSFIEGYVPFDPYEGQQYYGHIQLHPDKTILQGRYYSRYKQDVDSPGNPFEAVLFQ